MLDLSPNALIGIIAGPVLVFIFATAGWFVRRSFAQLDREIDKMAVTQREFGEKLANLLASEQVLNMKLKSGFERVDRNFDAIKTTFKHETDNVRKDMVVMSNKIDKNMEVMAANVDKEFEVLRSSFREMKADVSAHDALVDRDLAEIREWLKGDGTWPSRGKGNGSP